MFSSWTSFLEKVSNIDIQYSKCGEGNDIISILTWNILSPSLYDNYLSTDNNEIRLKKIVDYILSFDSDIINLTEIDEFFNLITLNVIESKFDQKTYKYDDKHFTNDQKYFTYYLNELFEDYNFVYNPKPDSVDKNKISTRHGNLFLFKKTKFSLENFISSNYTIKNHEPNVDNQIIVIIDLKRKDTNEKFIFVSAHLKSGTSFEKMNSRLNQLKYILEFLKDLKYENENIILVGDFNEILLSKDLNYIENHLKKIVNDEKEINKFLLFFKNFFDNYEYSLKNICLNKNDNKLCSTTQAEIKNKNINAKDSKKSNEILDYILINNKFNNNYNIVYVKSYDSKIHNKLNDDKLNETSNSFIEKNLSDHFPIFIKFESKKIVQKSDEIIKRNNDLSLKNNDLSLIINDKLNNNDSLSLITLTSKNITKISEYNNYDIINITDVCEYDENGNIWKNIYKLNNFNCVYIPKNRYDIILSESKKLRVGNLVLLNKNKIKILNCFSCPYTYMKNCNQLIVVIKCLVLNKKELTIFSIDLNNQKHYEEYNKEFKNDINYLNDKNDDLETNSYNYLYRLIYILTPKIFENKNENIILIGNFNINKLNNIVEKHNNLKFNDINDNDDKITICINNLLYKAYNSKTICYKELNCKILKLKNV